jgi:hypothetical protein
MSKMRWGDAEDDEDVLPENTSTGPNEKGILTKTEYYHNAKGEPVKKTTKIQLAKVQTRFYDVCPYHLFASLCCMLILAMSALAARSGPLPPRVPSCLLNTRPFLTSLRLRVHLR